MNQEGSGSSIPATNHIALEFVHAAFLTFRLFPSVHMPPRGAAGWPSAGRLIGEALANASGELVARAPSSSSPTTERSARRRGLAGPRVRPRTAPGGLMGMAR